MQIRPDKIYLGDSVYVRFDEGVIILTTENGLRETNRIVLEPEVYNNLKLFVERLDYQAESE